MSNSTLPDKIYRQPYRSHMLWQNYPSSLNNITNLPLNLPWVLPHSPHFYISFSLSTVTLPISTSLSLFPPWRASPPLPTCITLAVDAPHQKWCLSLALGRTFIVPSIFFGHWYFQLSNSSTIISSFPFLFHLFSSFMWKVELVVTVMLWIRNFKNSHLQWVYLSQIFYLYNFIFMAVGEEEGGKRKKKAEGCQQGEMRKEGGGGRGRLCFFW